MRAIGTTLWVSAVLFELGGCGPRVSVGDLGAAGASDDAGSGGASASKAGSSQGGANSGQGGSKVTGGGGTETSKGGGPDESAGGEAVAEGGAAPGSGGRPATGCTTFGQPLPPVAVECPDAVPGDGDACDVAENGICVWQTGIVGQGNVGYEIRGCYSAPGGKEWYGVGQGNLGPVGVNPQHCPKALPEAGSSCSGHDGENCYFPEAACACGGGNPNWQCSENAKPNLVPRPVERLCVPEGLDEAKAIKDLSNDEIATWCTWYGGSGPRPPLSGVDQPGYATSYGSAYGHIGGKVCMMDLPHELCVKNMQLYPSCTATLEQLDDCVESIRAWAGNAWVGHGCGPLLSNTSCAGLIVQPLAENSVPSDCKVPVGEAAQ